MSVALLRERGKYYHYFKSFSNVSEMSIFGCHKKNYCFAKFTGKNEHSFWESTIKKTYQDQVSCSNGNK